MTEVLVSVLFVYAAVYVVYDCMSYDCVSGVLLLMIV